MAPDVTATTGWPDDRSPATCPQKDATADPSINPSVSVIDEVPILATTSG